MRPGLTVRVGVRAVVGGVLCVSVVSVVCAVYGVRGVGGVFFVVV